MSTLPALSYKQNLTLLNEVSGLISKLESIVRRLERDHPTWHRGHDARLAAFKKLAIAATNYQLLLIFRLEWESNPDLRKRIRVNPGAGDTSKINPLELFDTMALRVFADGVFSAAEDSLRLFLRALDPKAASNSRGEFKSVYECLYKSHVTVVPTDATQLLDILRHARNTMHNNGRFLPKNDRSESIAYREKIYKFAVGQMVIIYTDTLISLMHDLVDLLEKTVDAEPIASLLSIDDPTNLEFRALEGGESRSILGE